MDDKVNMITFKLWHLPFIKNKFAFVNRKNYKQYQGCNYKIRWSALCALQKSVLTLRLSKGKCHYGSVASVINSHIEIYSTKFWKLCRFWWQDFRIQMFIANKLILGNSLRYWVRKCNKDKLIVRVLVEVAREWKHSQNTPLVSELSTQDII